MTPHGAGVSCDLGRASALLHPVRKVTAEAGLGHQGAAGRLTILLRKAPCDLRKRAKSKALAELAEAQAAVLSLKDAIIRRSGLDGWRELWGEVRKEREIRKTRERFAAAARRVHLPPRLLGEGP
jgi:hypothetical protein